MLYVDDKLPRHPKIFRAGSKLGPNGPAMALAMFMDGLAYAREHLTDGFLPDAFVASCGLVQTPQSVALALSSRAVKLWHRTRGGYQINDYHDWNRKASEIKENREKWRKKKATQRRGKNGEFGSVSPDVSPGDEYRDSRARASTYHVPRTQLELVPPPVLGNSVQKNKPTRSARRDAFPVENSNAEGLQATDGIPSGLRDRARGNRSGPDDKRQRMEGRNEGSSGQAGLRQHPAGHAGQGVDASRTSARTHLGPTPSRPADTDIGGAIPAATGSTVESPARPIGDDVAVESDRTPEGLRSLCAAVQHIAKAASA